MGYIKSYNYVISAAADYSKGFGGKYGIQKDRVDQSALGWDHQESLGKHESQTGISFHRSASFSLLAILVAGEVCLDFAWVFSFMHE